MRVAVMQRVLERLHGNSGLAGTFLQTVQLYFLTGRNRLALVFGQHKAMPRLCAKKFESGLDGHFNVA